jgi:hypothetical protein
VWGICVHRQEPSIFQRLVAQQTVLSMYASFLIATTGSLRTTFEQRTQQHGSVLYLTVGNWFMIWSAI